MSTTKKKPVPPPATPSAAALNGVVSEVLTLPEAAAYLRLSEATVLDLVHADDLPGRLAGNEWRFLKAALQQWLSSGSISLQAQKEAATDPLQQSFAALMLGYARGDIIDMTPTLKAFPLSLTSVKDYAQRILRPASAVGAPV